MCASAGDLDEQVNLFYYGPLDTSRECIRLLDILRPTTNGILQCRLKNVEFTRARSFHYTALSYTWGEEPPDEHILLNGRYFPVRPNLWNFLKSLGQVDPGDGELFRNLWIDAICIDQSSQKEKNHQVRFMRTIFSNATKVLVWLGPSDWSSRLVSNFAKVLQSHELKDGTLLSVYLQRRRRESSAWQATFKILKLAGCDISKQSLCNAVQHLSRRMYWTRLWVIQEFCLAPQLFILCGTDKFYWNIWEIALSSLGVLKTENITRAMSLAVWRSGRRTTTKSIVQLLELAHTAKCLDPRDKLFGLLGLAEDGEKFPVDYGDSPTAVLYKALQCFKTPDALQFAQVLKRVLCADEEQTTKGLAKRSLMSSKVPDLPTLRSIGTAFEIEVSYAPLSFWCSMVGPRIRLARYDSTGTIQSGVGGIRICRCTECANLLIGKTPPTEPTLGKDKSVVDFWSAVLCRITNIDTSLTLLLSQNPLRSSTSYYQLEGIAELQTHTERRRYGDVFCLVHYSSLLFHKHRMSLAAEGRFTLDIAKL